MTPRAPGRTPRAARSFLDARSEGRSLPGPTGRWLPALVMLALLAVAACGPQPELDAESRVDRASGTGNATAAPAEDPTAEAQAGATADAQANPGDAGAAGGIVEIALPPVGPAAPDAPAPFRWYEAMRTLECGLIADAGDAQSTVPEPQRSMFASLAQLCTAWSGAGGSVDWGAAATAVRATAAQEDCLVAAARRVLAAAVSAHESDPAAQVRPGRAGSGTACPVAVSSVTIGPGTEPGRYDVAVRGPYLFGAQELALAGQRLALRPGVDDLAADPPIVAYSAEGSACLPAGEEVTVTVTGAGYRVEHEVSPAQELGSCEPTAADAPQDAADASSAGPDAPDAAPSVATPSQPAAPDADTPTPDHGATAAAGQPGNPGG